jgi:RNA polymerase sigma-70 factor, ECF subfamily
VAGVARSDDDLVVASRDEPALFGLVFERHYPAVRGFCMRRLGREPGEAAASEVFARAFAARGRYAVARGDVVAWLFAIATNVIREQRRAEEQRLRLIARLAAAGWTPPQGGPEESVLGRSARELAAALLALAPMDRDALLLHAWAGLSYEQVAAIVGVPVGTVRSRLHRARRLLREYLEVVPSDG